MLFALFTGSKTVHLGGAGQQGMMFQEIPRAETKLPKDFVSLNGQNFPNLRIFQAPRALSQRFGKQAIRKEIVTIVGVHSANWQPLNGFLVHTLGLMGMNKKMQRVDLKQRLRWPFRYEKKNLLGHSRHSHIPSDSILQFRETVAALIQAFDQP